LEEFLPAKIVMGEEERKNRWEEFKPCVEKVIKTSEDPHWKLLKKHSTYSVFWMRSDDSPLVFVKGEGIVDASVQDFFLQFRRGL